MSRVANGGLDLHISIIVWHNAQDDFCRWTPEGEMSDHRIASDGSDSSAHGHGGSVLPGNTDGLSVLSVKVMTDPVL